MKAFLFLAKTLLIVSALAVNAAAATDIKTTPAQGDVQFDAIGKPSMIKIKGKGEGAVAALKVDNNTLNGDFKFNVDSLTTGMGVRDDHMKNKYLQVKDFPQATLTLKDFKLPATWNLKNAVVKQADFSGTLKLHGVEKPIKGTFQIDNEKLAGVANFELNISDYGIEIPSYLGVKVTDTVKVAVTFTEMTATEVASAAAPKADVAAPAKKKK
ncbi:MAG: YceI family protein [Bdellovibrio sp.]|nr:YceI family protein [Bdellovibrio sp.]